MAYEIQETTAGRCPMASRNADGSGVVRCGLAQHHVGEHASTDGRIRWFRFSEGPADNDQLFSPWEQQFDAARIKQIQTELNDRISAVVRTQNERTTGLRRDLNRLIGMLGDGDVWNERKQLATLDDVHNWSRRHDQLTLSFSRLAERVTNTEEQGRISAEAIERLEQRLELPQAAWGHKSAEPPRHQTYQDAEGDLWRCHGERWHVVREAGDWGPGGDGVAWPFPDDGYTRKYFPWKVWNGRD